MKPKTSNLEATVRPLILQLEALAQKLEDIANDNLSIGETITCPECGGQFAIYSQFMGILTCCYCGHYIEG